MKKIDKGFFRWNKDEFLLKKINASRSVDWYESASNKNLKASLVLCFFTFFLVLYSVYAVYNTSADYRSLTSSTSGDITEYNKNK